MRQRLEEKNRMIEKKTQAAMQAQQERNRMNTELTEIKDHMDIKDRKINVLQRKVSRSLIFIPLPVSLLEKFPPSRRNHQRASKVRSRSIRHLFSTTFVYFSHFSYFCADSFPFAFVKKNRAKNLLIAIHNSERASIMRLLVRSR